MHNNGLLGEGEV